MKKLYTFAIAISAAMAVNAQSVGTDVSELPSSTTAQLGEFSQTGLKAQPGLPAIQAPLTFDAYYNRKSNWDVPVITAGSSTFFATYSFGAPGQIGVHFDNSASVMIDRVLVNFFLKSSSSGLQSFNAFIYPAGSDSLPNGGALATKGFGYHDVYAPTTGFDSAHYTTISFSSPVTVTSDFVAAIQIDNATSGSTRDRIGIGMNDCVPGDGNNEKRACVYPVPGAAGTSGPMVQKWYKFNDFYNTIFGTTVFSQWNCEPLIIPLVVGETTPLGTDQVLGKSNGLEFNGHYPSPAVESIKINYTTESYNNVVNLRVYDITGRTILETNNIEEVSGKHSFDVNVSTLASGEYFYTIKTDNASISSHFVVTK